MEIFLQQLVNGLTLGSLYALIAVGYTVVYGIVQLINFAHGEVFMIGAFGALATYLLLFQGQTALWILPIMMIGAIFASVGTAVLMERVAYRPLRNAPRLAPLITAIGISVFLQEFVRLFFDKIPGTDFPSAKAKIPFPQIDVVTGPAFSPIEGVTIQRAAVFTVAMMLLCAIGLWYFVNRTKLGRGMQAVSPRACRSPISTSRWASSPASRPSRRPSSAASATSREPSSAASSWAWPKR